MYMSILINTIMRIYIHRWASQATLLPPVRRPQRRRSGPRSVNRGEPSGAYALARHCYAPPPSQTTHNQISGFRYYEIHV